MGRVKITCKMCRREGVSLCGREKCALKRRPQAPGVHGMKGGHIRMSAYGQQLREKQKAKRLYNVMERQFRRYFAEARQHKGNTGEILVTLLEERLDNVVYRLGFAITRAQARQMVGHGFFQVNGKDVDIASYQVHPGDLITVKESKKTKKLLQDLPEKFKRHDAPNWLHMDAGTVTGKVLSHPQEDALKQPFDPKLIVELYSR